MTAITAYASISDLELAINAEALEDIPSDRQTAAIAAASRVIDSYLRSHFTLPLVQVGDDVKDTCAAIAAYRLLLSRGYNPEAGGDPAYRLRYEDAIEWLKGIAAGRIHPDVTDSSPGATEGSDPAGPKMVSSSQRGWGDRDDTNAGGGYFLED